MIGIRSGLGGLDVGGGRKMVSLGRRMVARKAYVYDS